jgi:glutaredoxin
MEIIAPDVKGFTIYSKSGCPNCTSVKKLIKEKYFFYSEINCDEYILEDKEQFLKEIENIAQKSWKTFPMVFYEGKFVGGLTDTTDLIDKILLSFEDIF